MLNITTEIKSAKGQKGEITRKKQSLKRYVLEKLRCWINSLLEGERDEFLGRGRHMPLDEQHDNYRNGYSPYKINLFGLGLILVLLSSLACLPFE